MPWTNLRSSFWAQAILRQSTVVSSTLSLNVVFDQLKGAQNVMGRFIKRTRLGEGTLTTKSRRNTDVKIRGAWFGTWEQRRYRHDPAGSRREEICMTYDMIIRQRQCEPEEGYDETTSYDFEKSHMSLFILKKLTFQSTPLLLVVVQVHDGSSLSFYHLHHREVNCRPLPKPERRRWS